MRLHPYLLGMLSLVGGITLNECPAVEYELRTEPIDIVKTLLNKQDTIAVHWGAVGGTVPRSGEEIIAERARIMEYLQSPEVVAWLRAEWEAGQVLDEAAGRAKGEATERKFRELAQHSGMPTLGMRNRRVVERPEWLEIPDALLPTLRIALLDASDERQREWALRERRRDPNLRLFLLGWDSLQAVEQWIEANVEVAELQPISTVEPETGGRYESREFAERLGVLALPAIISFPVGSQMSIEEGLEEAVPEEAQP